MSRRQYRLVDKSSGVGVLDKAAIVLGALEGGPVTLAQLVEATGLARPTAHRLAVALEHHRLVGRDVNGRFVLGPRIAELAASAGEDKLFAAATPVLLALRDHTGESAQVYRRQGEHRVCVASVERPSGLRDSVPVGATLTMLAGSAAQVMLAWEEPDRLHKGLIGARFTATTLSQVRRRGWAQSVGEREPGVASVSAPVRGAQGRVVAAISVSGPIERFSRQPGRLHAPAVMAAANRLTEALRRAGGDGVSVVATTPTRGPAAAAPARVPDGPHRAARRPPGAAGRAGLRRSPRGPPAETARDRRAPAERPKARSGGSGPSWCSPDGIRTRATAVRGRRPRPLDDGAVLVWPVVRALAGRRRLPQRSRVVSPSWGTRTRT